MKKNKTLADFEELNIKSLEIDSDKELDDVNDLWYFIKGNNGHWIVGSTGH